MARTKQRGSRRVERGVAPISSARPMDVDGSVPSNAADTSVQQSTRTIDSVTVTLDDHSGVMVDNPNVKVSVYAVDFPGYVSGRASSTTSAMGTVGGFEGIQDQRQAHPKQLKVKLRPEDPFCHPVIGTSKKSTNLMLLRLACDIPGNAEEMEGIEGTCGTVATDGLAEVDGRNAVCGPPVVIEAGSSAVQVDELYIFKHPADLQVDSLTAMKKVAGTDRDAGGLHGNVASAEHQGVTSHPSAHAVEVRGAKGNDSNNVKMPTRTQKLACVPAVFLVEGTAEYGVDTYGVGRESGVPSYLARGNNEVVVDYGMTNLAQLVRDEGGYYEASFEDTDSRLSPVGHAMRKIFLERPVYAAAPLVRVVTSKMNNAVFSDTDANEQLNKLCYRFSSGPWRGCWVRRGYDPRKDSQAGKYQVITLIKNARNDDRRGCANEGSHGNDVGWSSANDYDALCSLDATHIRQYPARIQMMDIKDEDVLGRLKQASGMQCQRKSGWQTASEMENLCQRISTILGDSTVRASEWEGEDIRIVPFSTIQSFGTGTTPIPAASKKRGEHRERASDNANDRDAGELFDILPEEYSNVIQKMGLTTAPKK